MKVSVPAVSNQCVGIADFIGLLIPNSGSSFASAMQANEPPKGVVVDQPTTVTNTSPQLGPSEHKERGRATRQSQPRSGPATPSSTVQPVPLPGTSIPALVAPVQMLDPAYSVAPEDTEVTPPREEMAGHRARPLLPGAQPAQNDSNVVAGAGPAAKRNHLQTTSVQCADAGEPDFGVESLAEVTPLGGSAHEGSLREDVQERAPLDLSIHTEPDLASRDVAALTVLAGGEPPRPPAIPDMLAAGGSVSATAASSGSRAPETNPGVESKEHVGTAPEAKVNGIEQQKKPNAEPQPPQSPTVAAGASTGSGAQENPGEGKGDRLRASASGAALNADAPGPMTHSNNPQDGGSANLAVTQPGQWPVVTAPHLTAATATVVNRQPEATIQQRFDANAVRALGSAMRTGSLGIQTELFGRVTIQSSAGPGELSAQLILENTKHGAILATHLPGLEQRIGERYGVNASIQMATGDQGSTGGGRGDNGESRQSQAETQTAAFTNRPYRPPAADSVSESPWMREIPIAQRRSGFSTRLDVTA